MAANTPVDELIVEFGGIKVRIWLTESGLVARPFRKPTVFRISPVDLARLAVYEGIRSPGAGQGKLNHIPHHKKRA